MRRALLHFFAIGAILFALDWWIAPTWQRPARPGLPFPNVPSASALASALAFSCPSGFPEEQAEAGARAGAEEVGPNCEAKLSTPAEPLSGAALDDELLYREALARGLDRDDPVVRRRLVEHAFHRRGGRRRAAPRRRARPGHGSFRSRRAAAPDRSDAPTLRAAGAPRRADRGGARRLPARTRGALRFAAACAVGAGVRQPPPEGSGAACGGAGGAAARRRRAARTGGGARDPFPVPGILPPKSERELAKLFGAPFAARVVGASGSLPRIAAWTGPIASACGLHLVWVYEAVPGRQPALAAVRSRVRAALLADRGQRAVAEATMRLRRRYATPRPIRGRRRETDPLRRVGAAKCSRTGGLLVETPRDLLIDGIEPSDRSVVSMVGRRCFDESCAYGTYSGILGHLLRRAGRALRQLPFKAEQVVEEGVARLRRRLRRSDFGAAVIGRPEAGAMPVFQPRP